MTIDPRLDPDRCEIGRLSDEQFRAVLADAAAEFQAIKYLRRRRRKSKSRAAPVDPLFELAPAGDELVKELR